MSDTKGSHLSEQLTTFVQKVLLRQQEIIAELEPQLPLLPSIQVLLTALTALDQRIEKLGQRICDKEDKLADESFALDDDDEIREALNHQKDQALMVLEHTWQTFRARACANAARAIFPAAEREMREPQRCQNCGADFKVDKPYLPETVHCPYCGGVTQVLVTDAVSAYYSYAPDFLASEACLPLRHEIDLLQEKYRTQPPDTSAARVAVLEQIEAQESRYWKRYCETRANVFGEPADMALHDARLEAFQRGFLHGEPAWIEKHKKHDL